MSAENTKGTVLKYSETADGTFTKLFPIKDYPNFFGKPNRLATTTLDDEQETNINGIKKAEDLDFTANYNYTDFAAGKALEGKEMYWRCEFENGEYISWQGEITISITGKGVDAVKEMVASISQSTACVMNEATTS